MDERHIPVTMAVWDEDEWQDYPLRSHPAPVPAPESRRAGQIGPRLRAWSAAALAAAAPLFSRRTLRRA